MIEQTKKTNHALPTCRVNERRDEDDREQDEKDGDKLPRAPPAEVLFGPPVLLPAVRARRVWRRPPSETLVVVGVEAAAAAGDASAPAAAPDGRPGPNQSGGRRGIAAGRGEGRVVLSAVADVPPGVGRGRGRSAGGAGAVVEHLAAAVGGHVMAGGRHGEVVVVVMGAVGVVGVPQAGVKGCVAD